MEFDNREEFGCNILTIGEIMHYLSKDVPELINQLTNEVRSCYANVAMFNLSEDDNRFADATKNTKKLFQLFPEIAHHIIPSSMGNYNTHLYIIDVAQIPKSAGAKRSNAKFEDIDEGYDDEEDCF